MVVKNDKTLTELAKEDDEVELWTAEDYVQTTPDIDATMYALSGTGRNLQTVESEQTKAEHLGKAFLSGLTLNNVTYEPDDLLSAEGAVKLIGEAIPLLAMWQAGAVVSGRAIAALNYATKPAQFASRVRPPNKPYTLFGKQPIPGLTHAPQYEDTWTSFIPQVGIEAGLWTAADPTMDGADGFMQAVAYTSLGQSLGIGLNTYFKGRGLRKKAQAEA